MSEIPNAILVALGQLDKRKSQLLDLEKPLSVATDLFREFDSVLSEPRVEPWPDRAQRMGQITVVSHPIKTISEVQPWLTFLAKAGYRQTQKAVDITVMEGIGFRQWNCGPISLIVPVINNPDAGSQEGACRYVAVGTKEVPVFELQCDD